MEKHIAASLTLLFSARFAWTLKPGTYGSL